MIGKRAALLAALALLSSAPVRAELANVAELADFGGGQGRADRAQLELLINGVSAETVLVLFSGKDVLVAPEDLERAGLRGFAGHRVEKEGRAFLVLRSLSPDVTYEVDETALALRLSVAPELLGTAVVDLRRNGRPAGVILHRDTSAFANYSLQLVSGLGLSAFAEAGASWKGALAYSGATRTPDGQVIRGLSNVTYDEPDKLRRWTVGDAIASGSLLGGGGVLAGISIAREYSLDPYFIRGPLPRLQSFALTPSTLDVYVNGVLVRQEQVKAGQFELLNLPIDTGNGSYRTVMRDAFGRTQEISGSYYFSSGLLAKGLTDYAYQVGLRRNQYGLQSWEYGGPALFARHRLGWTDWLTAGARMEAARGLVSGGPMLTAGLPFGELELSLAASGGAGGPGAAGSLSYSYLSRKWSAGAVLRAMSASYANLSLGPQDERSMVQASIFAGVPIAGRVTLNAEIQAAQRRDNGYLGRYSLRADTQLGRGPTLSVSVAQIDSAGTRSLEAYVTLTYALEAQTAGSVSASRHDGAQSASFSAQRSPPMGEGFGYRVSGDSGGAGLFDSVVQYQGAYGAYQAEYHRNGDQNTGVAQASGGLVAMSGDVFATRPVQDGYALIQVPGVGGVRGFLNNQEVGRTNSRGNLLVPALSSYYGNRVSISPTDLPLDYDVGGTEQLVATYLRSGAHVLFPVHQIQALTGLMETEEGRPPAFGELRVAVGEQTVASPIGSDGRFWLDGLPAGRHTGTVEFGGGVCRAELEVPVSRERSLDVGVVRCAPADPVASR